jgi:hypothetical protein
MSVQDKIPLTGKMKSYGTNMATSAVVLGKSKALTPTGAGKPSNNMSAANSRMMRKFSGRGR